MVWTPIVFIFIIGCVIAQPPTLKPPLTFEEKSTNESFIVFCTSSKVTEEKVMWTNPQGKTIGYKKTGSQDGGRTGGVHIEDKPPFGLALVFERVQASDNGKYTCTSASKEKVSFELKVFSPIQFVNTPNVNYVSLSAGNTIIKCEATGVPAPTITWLRNGIPVEGEKYEVLDKGLKVYNLTKEDTGNVTCRAVQLGSKDATYMDYNIFVLIQYPPEWRDPNKKVEKVFGYPGGETNLTCEALAEPPATYTWTHHNKELSLHKINATVVNELGKSVLKIIIKKDSDYGQYECQAKNFIGNTKRKFELSKGEKPPAPTGFRLVRSTLHEAYLKIASDEPDVKGYRALFALTLPGQDVSWVKPDYQDMQQMDEGYYMIIDLLEDTSYTIKVATRSPAGLSDYTNDTILIRTLKTGELSSSIRLDPLYGILLISLLVIVSVH